MFPRLIIFDLDGTLIDSVPDLAEAVDAMLSELQLPMAGEDRVREWVGNGASILVERALRAAGVDPDCYPEALPGFLSDYQNHCAVKTCLYPGVLAALQQLSSRQVTMAIATNKPRRFIKPILQYLNIEPYFSAIVSGDDVSCKKPHPEQLQRCMQQLSASAEETLMVGDSANDIQAARQAGVKVVAVNYGYNHGRPIEEEQPDRVIANLRQLLDTDTQH